MGGGNVCALAGIPCPKRNAPEDGKSSYCPAWVEGIIEIQDGTAAQRATNGCYFRIAPRWASQETRSRTVHAAELSAMRGEMVTAVSETLLGSLGPVVVEGVVKALVARFVEPEETPALPSSQGPRELGAG